jgi:hypothetical protein
MAKLYIPTSTLNFNNILSSESISPKAFYSIRGFGYPRWTEVEENNNKNVIMLYSQPFSFVRPKSDMEDHPMLVEIVTDESFPMVSDGIFICDHTIYLSPWRTRFIFFSPQNKLVALSLSDSSLETKMLTLYSQRLLVQDFPLKEVGVLEISKPLNKEAVEHDFRINRMKGFLYGYYIGALLSNSLGIVKRANILQELRNIFFSILSTESRTPTILQQEKLENLFNEIQKSNPIVSYLQSIKKESASVEKIISDLTELGVVFPSKVNSVENIIQSLKYATDGNNYALDWLNGEEQKLNQLEQRNRTPLQVSAEEVVMVDNSLSKISNSYLREDNERALVRAWCNEVFALKEYKGKVSTFAESLSDEVTRKAKAVYGDSWEDSYSKSVLNQMRRYVRAQESNISWKDDLFSSIAAVIAKGSDWEQLRKFMQSKMMSDYKIAFAFFGELNGFANLTRDFTDVLFAHKDRNYVASVYKEIYGQLHGEDPSLNNENTILSDGRPQSNDKDTTEKTNESLRVKIETIIKAHPKTSLSEKDKEIIKRTLNIVQDEDSFIDMIGKEVGNPKSGIFKYIKKELKPKKEQTKLEDAPIDQKKTPKEASLFGYITNGVSKLLESDTTDRKKSYSIINDTNAVKILNSCPILPYDLKAQIVDIFKDFQRSYQSGYYFEHQNQYKRNNSDVIDHFIKFCLSKKNNRAIKWSPENSKLMDELKKYLMKFYAN